MGVNWERFGLSAVHVWIFGVVLSFLLEQVTFLDVLPLLGGYTLGLIISNLEA